MAQFSSGGALSRLVGVGGHGRCLCRSGDLHGVQESTGWGPRLVVECGQGQWPHLSAGARGWVGPAQAFPTTLSRPSLMLIVGSNPRVPNWALFLNNSTLLPSAGVLGTGPPTGNFRDQNIQTIAVGMCGRGCTGMCRVCVWC